MSAGQKIPATIVTGFLGAGKTTLLRHLLRETGGRRIALIVNEFGDMGFDGSLVDGCADADCRADEVVELTNGCICCTVADDFLPTMEMLIARDPAPDHIVIETSGLALPQPLVRAFSWPSVKTKVTVDAVVTVVDAAAVASGTFESEAATSPSASPEPEHESPLEELFEDQLVCADLVVLNKTDLVTGTELEKVREEVARQVRGSVEIIPARMGEVATKVILGRASASEDDMDGRRSHHEIHHGDEDHDHDDFESHVIETGAFEVMTGVEEMVRRAMAMPGVLRIKGAVTVAGKAAPVYVQAVGPRVEAWFAREAKAPGRLVVIGTRGFDIDGVRGLLAQALAA
ncbi:cobalamin biosynthesis protein CobW [Stappia sp. F7233]|uniref:Cobalamin biosynthesis protein CobW n=1 Tax=Stappia albiluteola TaxID=2758565 RepID=A0A839AC35_9HYPH|nr:cobalamin biosynthesis protein CobW [Stappia albiluteola]MBA5776447.1 cobalamin biosynthesis protein CobW [Stappia albiluteola]